MKTIGAVCVLMVLGASSAGAVDIKGKWGIGAGVFGGGGEVSLIRGRSERSAWLFDVGLGQKGAHVEYEYDPPSLGSAGSADLRTFSIRAGPGYRRFTRAVEDFSPYWDVRVRGSYSRGSFGSGSGSELSITTGAGADFSFGLEYFTPWHFSVAAHNGLASVSWIRTASRRGTYGSTSRATENSGTAVIGLSPTIFVRGYF